MFWLRKKENIFLLCTLNLSPGYTILQLLMTKKSPLVALTVLKKICDHPRLLSTKACAQLGVDGDEGFVFELI